MKKLIWVMLVCSICFMLAFGNVVCAESAVNVNLNGAVLKFDVPPVIISGRTMVPLRGIFEGLGAAVQWDSKTKTVVAQKSGTQIILVIGNSTADVSGKTVTLDAPATIVGGRTMVPVRFVAESFGCDVKWDAQTGVVSIATVDVVFEDKNLEAVVREKIKKPVGSISKSDLMGIQVLDASKKNISKLGGIQNLTNLRCLSLYNNDISDISQLETLTNMEQLILNINKIKDISALKNLKSLEILLLSNNKVDDVTPLAGLTKLTEVNLYDNNIGDISSLKDLTNLKILNIDENGIANFDVLGDYTGLQTLNLWGSDVPQKVLSQVEYVKQKCTEIVGKTITPGMSDYDKELALHDYIVNNVRYDSENYSKNTVPAESHNPYGTLSKGVAVCDGYAQTMNILLTMAGIESKIIKGDAIGSKKWDSHAWNIVKIDGEYYHLDATFDDPSNSEGTQVLMHSYFNVSDNQMIMTHKWDKDEFVACNKDNTSLYAYNGENNIITQNNIYAAVSNHIYAMSKSKAQEVKLSDDASKYLCVDKDENYVYYCNPKDGNKIYKVKSDGSSKTVLGNDGAMYLCMVDNKLYYVNSSSGAKSIYSIDATGNKTRITEEDDGIVTLVDIIGNNIYYKAYDFKTNSSKLYKMNLDKTEKTVVVDGNLTGFKLNDDGKSITFDYVKDVFFVNDWIYYCNADDGNSLYKIKTDGKSKTKLNSDNTKIQEILADSVYYKANGDTSGTYYKIKTDGTGKTTYTPPAS